jgi:hypothetical protein
MFYGWASVDAFDAWHQQVKQHLGIPCPGRNALTGEIDENAQWTEAYTSPVVVSDSDVRAFVEPDIAVRFPYGLGLPVEPPVSTDDD